VILHESVHDDDAEWIMGGADELSRLPRSMPGLTGDSWPFCSSDVNDWFIHECGDGDRSMIMSPEYPSSDDML
jgi:hypothetical protein